MSKEKLEGGGVTVLPIAEGESVCLLVSRDDLEYRACGGCGATIRIHARPKVYNEMGLNRAFCSMLASSSAVMKFGT